MEEVTKEGKGGGKKRHVLLPVQIDIEDDKSIEALYGLVTEKFGRVDVLLNNAGEFEKKI